MNKEKVRNFFEKVRRFSVNGGILSQLSPGFGLRRTRSSVDLTPSLLTIFDSYATGESCEHDSASLSQSTVNMADSFQNNDAQTTEDSEQNRKDSIDNNASGNELTVENKKRPLSVSSTSSGSSTSSLPRQQRKKKANSSTPDGLSSARSSAGDGCMDTLTDEETLADLPEENSASNISTLHPDDGDDTELNHSNRSSRSVGSTTELSDQKARHISRVIAEVIHTERTYVHDLKEIIEGYWAHVVRSPDCKLSEDDTNTLFGNVKDIHKFNSSFLEELEKCEEDPVQIARCFVDHSTGFDIYTEYCTHYPRAVEILTRCMRNPVSAEAFRNRQNELDHALPLGSYLLKPVQRILKYHLLLQSILKYYDKDRAGHDDIQNALSTMTNVAKHINEMKRKHEDAVRVQEVQSMLYDWTGQDLTTFGDLVLESSFRICGAKAFRQIYLFQKGLIIAKRKEDDGAMACKAVIMCSNLMLIESIPKEPLSFHVIPFDNPRMQYTLQARHLQQKREWCQELKRLILESYATNIPEKAKEIVMQQLGKVKDPAELGSIENVDSGRTKHSAPEYLEKRKGRRRSEFSLLKPWKVKKGEPTTSPRTSPPRQRKVSAVELQAHAKSVEKEKKEKQKYGVTRHRSHSLTSLDDIALDNLKEKGKSQDGLDNEEENEKQSYDDSCSRARRMSQVLDEEGLQKQLEKDNSDWDKDVVSSVLHNTRIKRAESFQKAVRLHRMASEKERPKFKATLSDSREQIELESESEDESVSAQNDDDEDDYVSLVLDDRNRVFADEESLYSNVVITSAQSSQRKEVQTKENDYEEIEPLSKTEKRRRKSSANTKRSYEYTSTEKSSFKTKWSLFSRPTLSRRHTETDLLESGSCSNKLSLTRNLSDPEQNSSPRLGRRYTEDVKSQKLVSLSVHKIISPKPLSYSTPTKSQQQSEDEHIYDSVYEGDDDKETTAISRKENSEYDNFLNEENIYDNLQMDNLQYDVGNSKDDLSNSSINDLDLTVEAPNDPWMRRYGSRFKSLGINFKVKSTENENKCYYEDVIENSNSSTSLNEKEQRDRMQRYATPPRTFGSYPRLNSDVTDQKKAVARYGTPPRDLIDPEAVHMATVIQNSFSNSSINLTDTGLYDNLHKPLGGTKSLDSTPRHEKKLGHFRSNSGNISPLKRSTQDIWADVERYIHMTSPTQLKSFTYSGSDRASSVSSESTSRSSTLEPEASSLAHYAEGQPRHKRSHSADQSTGRRSSSADRLVRSLRRLSENISSKLGSKISGFTSGLSPSPSEDSIFEEEPSNSVNKKYNKSVNRLARQYSRKIKNNTKPAVITSKSEGDTLQRRDSEQFAEMLHTHKPGSSSVGARIAEKHPKIILGDYTLERARPARPKLTKHAKSAPEHFTHTAILEALANLSASESEDEGTVVSSDISQRSSMKEKSPISSADSYYEERLSCALDEPEIFRDSAVYSDFDSPEVFVSSRFDDQSSKNTTSHMHSLKNSSSRNPARLRPRSSNFDANQPYVRKPGQSIQQRLQHLEKSSTYVKPESKLEIDKGVRDRLRLLEQNSKFRKKGTSVTNDFALPSVRERKSELVEKVYYRHRIRSSSLPPEELIDTLCSDTQSTFPKGHVRNVVHKFQKET